MLGGLRDWLLGSGLTPHGFCLLWKPGLIWTYAMSDIGIALAYFTIPVALAVLARQRRDLVFRPIFWLFAAFILLCGATHWLDVLTLWVPAYGLQAAIKAATALVSLVTAVGLWWLLPHALVLPSPRQMHQAHAALVESEARHRAGFERSPVPLYTVDPDGLIKTISESCLALLGYTADEVIGRNVASFYAADCQVISEEDRRDLMQGGELLDLPRRFVQHDGAVIDTLVSARMDQREHSVSIVCVVIDVTARLQAEAALAASEERLRQSQKMEAVGQLTGGIAHDFNNMLQGIVGCLDRMDRLIEIDRAAEVTQYVAMARASATRAANLTSRMLAFARRQPLLPRPVELPALIDAMAELIGRTLGPAVELRLDLAQGLWPVLCDANQLENALLNLAINARDAMPQGGRLTIAAADRRLSAAALADQSEAEPGDYVEITVSDTGAGMAPEVLQRVFEPFFTTKVIGQGTGLGLSQVYGFVRQSGGTVRLESAPGRGTAIRLCLPRHAKGPLDLAQGENAKPPPSVRPPDTAGQVVLLVDDEAGLRELIAEALVEAGCQVLEASSGPAGLQIVQSGAAIDLLVTDVGLPGLNGRQLADAARQERPGLPVLLITGFAGKALEGAEMPANMDVMLKPFGLNLLCDRVGALLHQAKSASRQPVDPAAPDQALLRA